MEFGQIISHVFSLFLYAKNGDATNITIKVGKFHHLLNSVNTVVCVPILSQKNYLK